MGGREGYTREYKPKYAYRLKNNMYSRQKELELENYIISSVLRKNIHISNLREHCIEFINMNNAEIKGINEKHNSHLSKEIIERDIAIVEKAIKEFSLQNMNWIIRNKKAFLRGFLLDEVVIDERLPSDLENLLFLKCLDNIRQKSSIDLVFKSIDSFKTKYEKAA